MRRLLLALPLALAACAGPAERPTSPPPPAPPQVQRGGALIGLTAGTVLQRFGQPELTIREGDGLKLQYRGACVLDVYLYPGQGGREATVRHVDARDVYGRDVDRETCALSLDRAL
ncbi:hypothetical protein [Sphingomicrobium nitratireducens]|uniref:hypothetical protein n=1 Tax=Sphingomicrobium nitratireducens TaxID=2964666 RepID=UPI00223EEC0A|nr:hypothetical protein [Sphingomicrobium nitratireducens]